MSVKSVAISSFGKFILGGKVFSRLLGIVTRHDDKDLTGDEKRSLALADIKLIGLDIGRWAINLGIELAVAWIRSRSEKS